MRAYEVLNENTADQLLSTMKDVLASRVANGEEKVSIDELVIALRNMGFNATREGIESVVNDSPFVHGIENGELNIGDQPDLVDTGDNADEQVDQMASGAVDLG